MSTVLPSPRATVLARTFRAVAIAEACSWIGLLIGMAFKYLVVFDDVGVRVFGPIHGALFVAYVVVALVTARAFRWSIGDDPARPRGEHPAGGDDLVRAPGRPPGRARLSAARTGSSRA